MAAGEGIVSKGWIVQLLRLYRPDVAAISFGAYVFGLVAAGGVELWELAVGFAISIVSFNYIYSLNSIEDRHLDRVNKPERPLAAGTLPLRVARRYVTVLLVLSLIYPFLVYANVTNLALFLILPILGWAYSSPPLRLRTRLIPALLSIVLMYLAPISIGFTYRLDVLRDVHAVILGYFFLFSISVIPLKDIEDVGGDQLLDSKNWRTTLGLRRLLALSLIGLVLSILLVVIAAIDPVVTRVLVALSGAATLLISAFIVFRLPPERLYRSLLLLLAALGIMFVIFTLILGVSL